MAEQVVGLKINVDGSDAAKSVGTLKSQLKEAQAAVGELSEKFGATSAAAVEAAKKAAKLKDAIGDAKALTDAFSPDEKFKAFGAALQGVAGGFAAVQGAQALFGIESEDVAKTLAKVQGALALSQGVDSILAAKDSFAQLGAKIKDTAIFQNLNNAATKAAAVVQKLFTGAVNTTSTSFKVLKGAIAASGIGLLVLLIGEVVNAFSNYTSAADKAAEAQKTLNEETQRFAEIGLKSELDYLKTKEKLDVAKAKLAGKTEAEIFAIQQDFREQTKRALQRNADEVKGIDVEKDSEKKSNIKSLNAEIEVAAIENEINLKKIKDQADKEKSDKDKANAAELNAANKQLQDDIKSLKDENYLKSIADDDERAKEKLIIEYNNQVKSIEQEVGSEKLKKQKIAELGKSFWIDMAAIDKEAADAKEAKRIEDEAKAKDAKDKYNEEEVARMVAEMDREAKATEEKIKLAEEERNAKVQFAQDIGNALSILGDLIGKQTAAGKALGIAQALINTWIGVSEVLRAKSVLPEPLATVSKVVNVAAIVATGIKAVKNITAVKVPGGGGGGGNTPSNLGVTAPVGMTPSNTLLNQQLINQQGNAAVRSFVLESDVSGNQERIRRLNRAARIN